MSERVDRCGAAASSLCAVHCAITALLPAAFGALGLQFLLGHGAEWAFTLVAVGLATFALALGWRRHRSGKVVALLALGVVGLLASRGLEMSSGHHAEAGDAHHAEAEPTSSHRDGDAHGSEEPSKAHADEGKHASHAHEDPGHLAGTAIGVLAGLLLLIGHILNIRANRLHAPIASARAAKS